ncbi:MAG: Citrate lyase [Rhizobacter sp.]|nr:Citrate lyase [Rhizobacter sp.]
MLFVSGEKPQRFAKALAAGADVVCMDLEDAVHPGLKAEARAAVIAFARDHARNRPASGQGPALAVRLNAITTQDGLADVQALVASGVCFDHVLLPKVEFARDAALLHAWAAPSFKSLVALVETPLGIENAHAIGSAVHHGAPKLAVLMLGGADLSAELGAEFSWDGLLSARGRLLNAARASGLQAWDVPFVDVRNTEGLAAETAAVLRMGYVCKTAIHPDQIGVIHAAFAPSAQQARWAQGVVQALEARDANQSSGAFLLDGKMIDAPVARNARRIVELMKREAARPPAPRA